LAVHRIAADLADEDVLPGEILSQEHFERNLDALWDILLITELRTVTIKREILPPYRQMPYAVRQ